MNIVIIVAFLFALCQCGAEEDYRRIGPIETDWKCTAIGGVCTFVKYCPKGMLVGESGLCPGQQHIGVECCYTSPEQKKCSWHGGACIPKSVFCTKDLIYTDATDCLEDEKCCIMT